ncbi:hypothetical protein ABIA48_002796 [Pseudomonas sp. S30_BP2TU TE3576]|uniref:hypothetical protein n=1 Tax=Pseudomonas sp. S30_BP2TU TE3576 TaxID=3349329 RepID=UPI003D1D3F7B
MNLRHGAGFCRLYLMPNESCIANGCAAVTVLKGCRKSDTFSPQVWRGDNCARQDETNPGERGYSMSGGNRFTDDFSSFRGLLAMPSTLMFAKPFDQR